MTVMRVERVVYGVSDLDECTRFLDDFGLEPMPGVGRVPVSRPRPARSSSCGRRMTPRLPDLQARLAPATPVNPVLWCRFDDEGTPRYGLAEDDFVVPLTGGPFGHYERLSQRRRVADLRWLPPVVPGTFFCAGLNYRAHAERSAAVPTRPEIGYRANNALIGHREPIVRPADYDEPLVAEGELVAVIGTTVPRHCSREEAMAAVLGWTIGNDVSAREWQRSDRTFWRCKNSDTFKPMGPYLVTGADPLSATTTVRVDGEVEASFPTGDSARLYPPRQLPDDRSRADHRVVLEGLRDEVHQAQEQHQGGAHDPGQLRPALHAGRGNGPDGALPLRGRGGRLARLPRSPG